MPFISADYISQGGLMTGSGTAGTIFGIKFASGSSVSSEAYEYWGSENSGSNSVVAGLSATGRWK